MIALQVTAFASARTTVRIALAIFACIPALTSYPPWRPSRQVIHFTAERANWIGLLKDKPTDKVARERAPERAVHMRSGGTLKRLSRSIEPLLQNCGRRTAAIGAIQPFGRERSNAYSCPIPLNKSVFE